MRSKARLAAPVLLAHVEATKKHSIFSMGLKLRYLTVALSDTAANVKRFRRERRALLV